MIKYLAYIASGLIFTTQALALSDVQASCISHKINQSKEFTVENSICSSFITGFLQGALISDSAKVESDAFLKSDFFARAYRTRAIRTDSNTDQYSFCLPENTNKSTIVETVLNQLSITQLENDLLPLSIYQVLKKQYPCS